MELDSTIKKAIIEIKLKNKLERDDALPPEYFDIFRHYMTLIYVIGFDAGVESLVNHNKKELIEYDAKGNELERYPSATIAAKRHKLDKTTLYKAIWGNRPTRNGHMWKYSNQTLKNSE